MTKEYKKVEDYDHVEVGNFYDYVFHYYGEGGLRPLKDKNQEPIKLSKEEIKKYCNQYIENFWNKELLPYQGQEHVEADEASFTDSMDSEMVLSLIEWDHALPLTNPYVSPPEQSVEWKEFHKWKD